MAVVPPMLVLVMLNQKKAAQPAIIDITAPVEFALLQYRPNIVGQKKTDSRPPKANRFIHTNREGGFIAAKKTNVPTTHVTAKLIALTLDGVKR